jgi:hypothetical protein
VLSHGLGIERDHGVELRVQALDAREKYLEQLAAADLASPNRGGEVEGGLERRCRARTACIRFA